MKVFCKEVLISIHIVDMSDKEEGMLVIGGGGMRISQKRIGKDWVSYYLIQSNWYPRQCRQGMWVWTRANKECMERQMGIVFMWFKFTLKPSCSRL